MDFLFSWSGCDLGGMVLPVWQGMVRGGEPGGNVALLWVLGVSGV